jgi:hypothetical protein
MKATRTITIVCHGSNHFDVFEGEEFCDWLCWDEMLGQVVHLTHPQIKDARYGMTDADRYLLRKEQHNRRMAEINAENAEEAGDTEAAIEARAAAWRAEQSNPQGD